MFQDNSKKVLYTRECSQCAAVQTGYMVNFKIPHNKLKFENDLLQRSLVLQPLDMSVSGYSPSFEEVAMGRIDYLNIFCNLQ